MNKIHGVIRDRRVAMEEKGAGGRSSSSAWAPRAAGEGEDTVSSSRDTWKCEPWRVSLPEFSPFEFKLCASMSPE